MICQRPGLKARAWKSRLLVPPQIAVTESPMAVLCSWKQNSLSAGVAGRSAHGPSSVSVPLA
jgi:hypothetical protein